MAKLLDKRRLPYIDARTEKWNQYEEYITSQGFAIYQVRGDGNCLFRAIAHQMDQDETLYATYRKLAVDYMRSHPYQFKFNLRTEQDGTFDEYLKKMERNREWGGHFEIFALSEALNVQIWLFQESFSVLKIGGPEYDEDGNLINSQFENRNILYIAYNRSGKHYNSVIKNVKMEIETINSRIIRKVSRNQKENLLKLHKELQKTKETMENAPIKKKVIKKTQELNKSTDCSKCGKCFTNNQELSQKKDNPKLNFKDIFTLNDKELIEWCLKTKLLKKPLNCKSCRRKYNKIVDVRLSGINNHLDRFVWRCKNKDCGWIENIRKENKLFEEFPKIKLRILLIYIFTHFTVLLSPVLSQKILGISLKSIRKLSQFLSSCIISAQLEDENIWGQLGGRNLIVEMDESCFFKRKNNKGRLQKEMWGFGLVERKSGRLFVEIVPKRNSATLVPIITKWVKKDTQYLISDEWKAYSCLKALGFNHITVKHKKEFVRSDNREIHTQNIENRWGLMKTLMKKRGKISRVKFEERIKEIAWRLLNKQNIQVKLLEIIVKEINK